MSDYYDRKGKPMTMHEWAQKFEQPFPDYRRVALDEVGEYRVSTVWLGADHRFGGDGPPLIFETMVFGGEQDGEYCDRYSTEEEALSGHLRTVLRIRDAPLFPFALNSTGASPEGDDG